MKTGAKMSVQAEAAMGKAFGKKKMMLGYSLCCFLNWF